MRGTFYRIIAVYQSMCIFRVSNTGKYSSLSYVAHSVAYTYSIYVLPLMARAAKAHSR